MPFDTVPKLGELVPRQALELKHVDYEARIEHWRFFRHSDELTGGYEAVTKPYTVSAGNGDVPTVKESYLIPHEKEDAYDYNRRVASARPPHFVHEGIEGITGVLTHRTASRVLPPKTTEWLGKVTRKGQRWESLISSEIVPGIERYGCFYSLAKPPSVTGGTKAEAEAARKLANLPEVEIVLVSPEALEWWETDAAGQLITARYVEEAQVLTYDGIWPTEIDTVRRNWYLTRLGWWFIDDLAESGIGGELLQVGGSGYWKGPGSPMTHHPLVKWALKDENAPTASAAFAQLAFYRKESELSSLETATCFPMTWVPVKMADVDPSEVVKGPNVVGTFDADGAHTPLILQPSAEPFTHYVEKRLPSIADDCLAPYGRRRASGGDDSGRALQHLELQAQNIWRQHSESIGESELMALRPVAEFLGEEITEEHRTEWPTDFGALSDEIKAKMLQDFSESMEPGPVYKRHSVRAWAGVAMPELTDEEHDEALDAMEAEAEERKANEEAMQAEMDDALLEGAKAKPAPFGKPASPKPSGFAPGAG